MYKNTQWYNVLTPQKKKYFHTLNVLSPWSHVIKAQCHWAKDIEHFGIDKFRVLQIVQK